VLGVLEAGEKCSTVDIIELLGKVPFVLGVVNLKMAI
jgi:hypothetical protein